MKKLLMLIVLLYAYGSRAQVKKISLQASGLTCSMCSNSIFKSLKTLDFVGQVTPDISTSTFDIIPKNSATVDFDQLKKKVEDAGFFVASLKATLQFDKNEVSNDSHITVNGMLLHFMNVKGQVLDGEQTVKLLDKGFVPAKEYKKNNRYTLMECYKTGMMGACCNKGPVEKPTRVYHVTI